MKILQFFISLLIIVDFCEISLADDNIDGIIMKRPFCNAFTGCGKKRDPAYSAASYPGNEHQLPMPVYRALLRIAAARSAAQLPQPADSSRLRQQLGLELLPPAQAAQFLPY